MRVALRRIADVLQPTLPPVRQLARARCPLPANNNCDRRGQY